MIGDVAGVKEGARVGGMRGEVGVELGGGSFPVGFDDGGFGVSKFGSDLRILGVRLRRIGCWLLRFLC